MEIRRAAPADSRKIAEMEAECFSDAWSEPDVLAYICSEMSMCYTAHDSDGLVGYILGRKIPPEAEIYRVAVRQEKRQRGIGYRLLSHAMRCEESEGVETVFLEVREANAAARALYRAEGFEEIATRKNYYRDPIDNAIIMAKGAKCQ